MPSVFRGGVPRPFALRRAVAVTLLFLAVLAFAPGRADTHAQLESTDPADGALLERTPERIVLRFDEAVEGTLGGVRLFDEQGRRLTTGVVEHPSGDKRVAAVSVPDLSPGTYVVAWRVTSADGHPVRAAFAFDVVQGGAVDTAALRTRVLGESSGDKIVGILFGAVRALLFGSLLVLAGGAIFFAWLWPAGWRLRRARRLVWTSWGVALGSTLLGIGFYGAYGSGLTIGSVFDPSVWGDVFDTRYGVAAIVRLVALVATALLLRRAPSRPGAAVVAVGLLLPSSFAGHAITASPAAFAIVADGVHLFTAAVWLGGLAAVMLALLPGGNEEEVTEVLPRFSQTAFRAVVLIVITGSYRGWGEIATLDGLFSTAYGRILLTKVALFVVLIALAAYSRRLVQARATTAPALRRSVKVEALVAAAVLVVTSLLVNAEPARTAEGGLFAAEMTTPELLVDVTVDPVRPGPTQMHFYTLDRTGAFRDVPELTASLRLPSQDIGPLDISLRRGGPGHFLSDSFRLPFSGRWELDVVVRTSDVDSVRASTTLPVR